MINFLFNLNFKLEFLYHKLLTNQTYWWNFGGLALYFLIAQIITGILLAKLKKQINKIINKY